MMFGLTTVVDEIWGGVPDTAIELTKEETVNWKFPETVRRKVESGVGTLTPIVNVTSKVETVAPGILVFCALMETMFIRLLFLS
jgi:hypothetical protein